MKVKFKRNKFGAVTISFESLTQGKALALCHAIRDRTTPIGVEIKQALQTAIQEEGVTEEDQQLFASMRS